MSNTNLTWRGSISIQEAYAEIKGDPTKTFWLCFVRATGKDAGSIKVVSTCVYGAPKVFDVNPDRVGSARSKITALHTDKGTLPMTDTTTGEYLTPLISHIIGYNLLKVKH